MTFPPPALSLEYKSINEESFLPLSFFISISTGPQLFFEFIHFIAIKKKIQSADGLSPIG